MATVRAADISGPAALTDHRLQEQLHALSGQRLSEYSIGRTGLLLSFWGENATTPSRAIRIEEEAIEITLPGHRRQQVPTRGELTATALLNTLDHRLSRAEISSAYLRLTFDTSLQLGVDPHQQWEAWQISSDDGLLIVCIPGGQLTAWYPGPRR